MKTLRENQNIVSLAAVFLVVAVLLALLITSRPSIVEGAAPFGLNARVATSSTLGVGPQNNVATGFGTTTNEALYQCAAREISTVGQPIMIAFSSAGSTTLSQTVGFQQAASTSVVYDGGLYGCGYMTIRGLNASTTITIQETQ